MDVIRLPDELQRAIERQVAEGRATTPAAFLEEAVTRLIDDTRDEEDDLLQALDAGSADIEAGRYVTVMTSEDERRVHDGLMMRLRTRFSTAD